VRADHDPRTAAKARRELEWSVLQEAHPA